MLSGVVLVKQATRFYGLARRCKFRASSEKAKLNLSVKAVDMITELVIKLIIGVTFVGNSNFSGLRSELKRGTEHSL